MTHFSQPLIDRLHAATRRAVRLRHFGWACRLESRAIIEVREARHALWLAALSPKERARMGMAGHPEALFRSDGAMIEPTDNDIGRKVIYTGNRYPGGELEEGVITSFNSHIVFVR